MTPRERFSRTLKGQSVDRPPVWLMRQAGRYLPEYQTIKQAHTFEQRVTNPEVAAAITLQPIHRFPLDAAIIFSDILVPLAGMGRPARFPPDDGPVIDSPVRHPEDVAGLRVAEPSRDFPFVAETIQRVRKAIPDHAVIGFAGAPFTLATYLIEGASPRHLAQTKRLCYHHPEAWHQLMDMLTKTTIRNLTAQANAGCDAVQLFDTWAEMLQPSEYETYSLPYAQAVLTALRALDVPTVYFARGTAHLLHQFPRLGASAWSIDWRMPLQAIRAEYPDMPLQGNLDPTLLFAPREHLRNATHEMLEALHGQAHIANLGHGVLPTTPIEGVRTFVETVTQWTP